MVRSTQGTQSIQVNKSNENINKNNDDNNTLKSRTNKRTTATEILPGSEGAQKSNKTVWDLNLDLRTQS